MAQIFLSYAREDIAVARSIKLSLERRGLTVFLDIDGLVRGPWSSALEREITAASDLVVLVSAASIQSAMVANEVAFAIQRSKPVVPVLLIEPPQETPSWLTQLLAIQAVRYDHLDLEVSTDRIVRALNCRPSPLRKHNNKFWISLAGVLSAGFFLALLLRTSPLPPEDCQAPPQRLASGDLSGCWNIEQTSPDATRVFGRMRLVQQGDELSGALLWSNHQHAQIVEGKFLLPTRTVAFTAVYPGANGLKGTYDTP